MSQAREQQAVDLLKAIAQGDESAIAGFYTLFETTVYRYTLSRLNDTFDAADVLNEVMMEVWKTAGRFEGRSKVSTWLLGIAHHKVIDRFRKRGSAVMEELNENMPDEQGEDDIERAIESAQNAALVKQCMATLSDEHREVLHMAFFEDMHYRDIAKIINCPEGTVKSRVYHAKDSLKRNLAAMLATG